MKKKKSGTTERKRVLARVLAEELRLVQGGCRCGGTGATVEVTGGGGDITNVGGDGDGPEQI